MKEPLASRIRPQNLDEIIGQSHLFGQDGLLMNLVKNETLPSMVFFGPPGSGKTTAALLLANKLNQPYRLFNAVTDSKKDLTDIYYEARMTNGMILIMDEVHRLNKDKQDTLLPHLENGLITLIGATTANPYFAINPAIRSRTHLVEFKELTTQDISQIIDRAIDHPKGFNQQIRITDEAKSIIAQQSNGDSRYALNLIELAGINTTNQTITKETLEKIHAHANIAFDSDDSNYFNTLSAFQKSIRGSDVNAALYYLAILLEVGDLISIERRLTVTAYEDIGLANPGLVSRVLNACEVAKRVGMPEARIPLANIVIELALSPKSKSAIHSIDRALNIVRTKSYPMPEYLVLTPVNKTDEEKYDYSKSDHWHSLQYLPEAIKDEEFYIPENTKSSELTYHNNYQKLKTIKRTSNIKSWNKK